MSDLLNTAHKFIQNLASLNVALMLSLRTPDCQQVILPGSLGRNPISNDDFDARGIAIVANVSSNVMVNSRFRQTYSGYLSLAKFADYNITIHDELVDERQNKVVLHATGKAKTIAGDFNSEYIFTLSMVKNESDGQWKINKVVEFVDSKLSQDQGAKIKDALAKCSQE